MCSSSTNSRVYLQPNQAIKGGEVEMNTYLIAFVARNDRVMSEEIEAKNQKEAIRIFKRYSPCCDIIAITLLED